MISYKQGDYLPVPSDVVRKPISEGLERIDDTLYGCTASLQNIEDIDNLVLEYIDDKRGYKLTGLTEKLNPGNYFGTLWSKYIQPIEIEFIISESEEQLENITEDSSDDIELVDLPEKYKRLIPHNGDDIL